MVQTIGNDRFDLYQMDSLDSARAWGMFGVLWFAPLHLATGTRHPKNPPKPFSVIPPRKVFICFPSTCQMYSLLTYFNYLDLEKFGNSVRFSRQRHPDTDKYKVLPRPNIWRSVSMSAGSSPKVGWKWKWSNGVGKSEMSIIWCIYITNNVKSNKKNHWNS